MPNLVKIGKELVPKMSGNQVGRRTADGGKSKNNMSNPPVGGHNYDYCGYFHAIFQPLIYCH